MSKGTGFWRRTLRSRVGDALLGALLFGTGSAAAEPNPEARAVEVAGPPCKTEAFPLVAFLDALRVELAGRPLACCTLVDPSTRPMGSGILRVSLDIEPCGKEATSVRLGVRAPQEIAPLEHQVSLADVAPSARARALALAAAELIRSLGDVRADPTPAVVDKAPPPPPPMPPPVTAPVSFPLVLGIEGQARVVPTRETVLWGGRMRLTLPGEKTYAQLDLGAEIGSARADGGTVSLRGVSLGLGAGARWGHRMAVFALGPRLELGGVWIRGESGSPDVTAGSGAVLLSTLGMRASLEIPAAIRLRPGIALEGGGVLHGARGEADGRTVIGVTGYYLIGTLAIAVSL